MGTARLDLSVEEMKVLRLAKKKRRVSHRDCNWWLLVSMLHKGAINRVDSRDAAGWPYFVLSKRGKALLKRLQENQENNVQR